jgi:hypothetical protein
MCLLRNESLSKIHMLRCSMIRTSRSGRVISMLDRLSLTRLLPTLENSEERQFAGARSDDTDFVVQVRDDASHMFFFDRIPVSRK